MEDSCSTPPIYGVLSLPSSLHLIKHELKRWHWHCQTYHQNFLDQFADMIQITNVTSHSPAKWASLKKNITFYLFTFTNVFEERLHWDLFMQIRLAKVSLLSDAGAPAGTWWSFLWFDSFNLPAPDIWLTVDRDLYRCLMLHYRGKILYKKCNKKRLSWVVMLLFVWCVLVLGNISELPYLAIYHPVSSFFLELKH